MWENKQKTLNKTVDFLGTGLHSGKTVSMKLHPAEANTGIVIQQISFFRVEFLFYSFH